MTVQVILGRALDGSIVTIPLDQLRERHFMIQGATGQRKTLFLLSLLCQFHAAGDAVIFIDLGGDRAAYWILRKACRKSGKQLYLFSLDRLHNSYYFDPLTSVTGFSDPVIASNAIALGLNLIYSEGYGRTFWGRFNLSDVNEAFDRLFERGLTRPTFRDLIHELKLVAKARRRRGDVSEAVLAADQLSRLEHFRVSPDPAMQLSIASVIEEGAIAYFWLPTALYGATARAMASLASWCVMVEMAQRDELLLPPKFTQLGTDEYSQIAAGRSALESQLVLSRKWGLQNSMVFQSREQMQTADGDLFPVLRENCQRFHFTLPSEDEQRELMACSKDVLKEFRGQNFQRLTSTTQVRQELLPQLERNEVLDVSGKAMQLFAVLDLGDMHRDPIPFEIIPPTESVAEHEKLKRLPLPRKEEPCKHLRSRPADNAKRNASQAMLRAIHEMKLTALGIPQNG